MAIVEASSQKIVARIDWTKLLTKNNPSPRRSGSRGSGPLLWCGGLWIERWLDGDYLELPSLWALDAKGLPTSQFQDIPVPFIPQLIEDLQRIYLAKVNLGR